MFTVGQTFTAPNNPGRTYRVNRFDERTVTFDVINDETGTMMEYGYAVYSAESYVRDGFLIPCGPPPEPISLSDWMAARTQDDAMSSALNSQLYAIIERLTGSGTLTWSQFDYFNSSGYQTLTASHLDCMASDNPKLPWAIRDAGKSSDGLVYGLPMRSLRSDTFDLATVRDASKYQPIKLGKLLRSMYPDWSDHSIAAIVDSFKARHDNNMSFDIVSGDDIAYWYDESQYHPERSNYSLDMSCMRYDHCASYFGIYTDNQNVRLLIVTVGGMLVGRALVWTLDNGGFYVDRFYGQDATVVAGIEWFRNQTDKRVTFHLDGDYPSGVTLRNYDFSQYPYMDTLRYLDMDTGRLSPYSDDSTWYRYLSDVGGGYDETNDRSQCADCGDYVDNDDLVWTDSSGYVCQSCYENRTFCEECQCEIEDGETLCDYCASMVTCAVCDVRYRPDDLAHHVQYHHAMNGPWFSLAGTMPDYAIFNQWRDEMTTTEYRATFDAVHFAYDYSRNMARMGGI